MRPRLISSGCGTGTVGPTGATGPTGPTGTSLTANSMYAGNTRGSTIFVLLGGTSIPLPDNQNLDAFPVNGANTTFTIPVTGRYYLTYQINTTLALLTGSRLMRNGTAVIPGSIINPALSTSGYNNDVIVNLTMGDTISLQLFGLADYGHAILPLVTSFLPLNAKRFTTQSQLVYQYTQIACRLGKERFLTSMTTKPYGAVNNLTPSLHGHESQARKPAIRAGLSRQGYHARHSV